MRFKIDKNLNVVAAAMATPVAPETVAVELCDRFIDAGMIEVTADHWGESVLLATGPQYVADMCKVLAGYLYNDETRSVPADVFDAFCALTIMGDGDCPHCGGELKFIETEGHYYTPISYVIDNYIYICRNCGKIIKSEKEL